MASFRWSQAWNNDAIVASVQLINALQTIVSRTLNPSDPAVVSITQIHAGNTWNAIPESVVLRGTFRCFSRSVQTTIANKITQLAHSICGGFNLSADIRFNRENAGYIRSRLIATPKRLSH